MKCFFILFLILSNSYIVLAKKDSCLVQFKKIAEDFNTHYIEKDSSIIPDVFIYSKTQRKIMLRAIKMDKKEAENFVMLILLKVYKSQLECCKMGYNLAVSGCKKEYNTIVYLFIKMSKFCNMNSKMDCTYISSTVPYNWVKSHQEYFSYSSIQIELDNIEKLNQQ